MMKKKRVCTYTHTRIISERFFTFKKIASNSYLLFFFNFLLPFLFISHFTNPLFIIPHRKCLTASASHSVKKIPSPHFHLHSSLIPPSLTFSSSSYSHFLTSSFSIVSCTFFFRDKNCY